MIYVYDTLGSSREGLLKIGWTERDSLVRLREQQTGNPEPFRLLMEFDAVTAAGLRITDRMVHAQLARMGVERVQGEWFRCPLSTVRSTVLSLQTGQAFDAGRFDRRALRPDQAEAVSHALEDFRATGRASWRVAPGFGVVEAALEWAQACGARRILVTAPDPAPWREAMARRVSLQALSRAGAVVFSPDGAVDAEISLDMEPVTNAAGLRIVRAALRSGSGGWQQDIFDRLLAMSEARWTSDWSWFGFPSLDYQVREGAAPLFEGDGVGRDARQALADLAGPDPSWNRLAVVARPDREAALATWIEGHLPPGLQGCILPGSAPADAVALLDPVSTIEGWADLLAQALLPQVLDIEGGVQVAACTRVTVIDPFPARLARIRERLAGQDRQEALRFLPA